MTHPQLLVQRRKIIVRTKPPVRFFSQIIRADGHHERPILWHDDPALPPLLFPFDQWPDATLVVNAGRAVVTALLAGGVAYPRYVGWGTGAGTTLQTDTDLFIPATEARVAGTQSQQTGVTANDTYQLIATLQANAAKTVTNVMIFDSAGSGSPPSGGNGYLKSDFTGQALNLNDTIQFTFQIRYL